MALKSKIDEETFKKLHKDLQSEYKKQDDGSYILDIEGAEDTGALKRAKDHEKEQRKEAEKKAKEAQEALEEAQAELEKLQNAGKSGDDKVAAAEKAWKTKLEKRERELQAQVDAANAALKSMAVDAVATGMAAELAGDSAEILLPHITRRLTVEIVDGKAVTKVLGTDGQPSALTPEELKKEILSNDKFAPIIVASKASGGGAGGARRGASGAKKLSEMTATEEAVFANQHPTEYQQMVAAEGKK